MKTGFWHHLKSCSCLVQILLIVYKGRVSLCTAGFYSGFFCPYFIYLFFFCSFTVYIILQVLRNYSVKIFHIFTLTNIMCSYFVGRGWLLGHISFNDNSRTFGHLKNSISKVFSVKYSIVFKVFKISTPHNGQNPKGYISRQEILFIQGLFNNQNKCTYSNGEVCYINFPKSKMNKNRLPINYEMCIPCLVIL